MEGLNVFSSNRLENLGRALAGVLAEPLGSPFDPEIIIVQSKGMERWVSMQLATYHGICANCKFPFPNAFIENIFRNVLGNVPRDPVFAPEVMTWTIVKRLPSLIKLKPFKSLRVYLGQEKQGLKLFQLSERIADTFDQYLLFRPDMIFKWENHKEDHWQAILWRDVVKQNRGRHRAALGRAFFEALSSPGFKASDLPQRVSVFGISSLPRFHMQVLAALSKHIQVNLFLMNPCREYWGDIVSSREIRRRTSGKENGSQEHLHLEKGNSLLSSMGTLGRDFFDLINEFQAKEFPSFEDPGQEGLLSCIQSDILNLRERGEGESTKKKISSEDSSVQIHSCHSPMREIEVLHDQLLHMFEKDKNLKPKDILVMTPDIEAYAPFIQAVFDLSPENQQRIPFSIADRSFKHESGIAEAFLSILDLRSSRLGALQVVTLLEVDAVRKRFGLKAEDLERIREWVRDTGIRWGIDASSRSSRGLPPFSENTWKAGFERLLMGYAMPGYEARTFGNILPYDNVEGAEAQVLGALVEFGEKLFAYVDALGTEKTLKEWSEELTQLLDSFFIVDEVTQREIGWVRGSLQELASMQDLASFDAKVGIDVIRHYLGKVFSAQGLGFGFMTGGVTFCAMLPMRSIPFDVVCLVGMNTDAYPRHNERPSFDLMAKNPRPGDRSRRNDDRYLFLEAIISARKTLYISYVGQSARDNTIIPPSPLVSELIDYIDQGFETAKGPVRDHVLVKHRLQGFSREYFTGRGKLFSYSEEKLEIAKRLLEEPSRIKPFIEEGLSEPGEEWKTVEIDDLCRFFRNPARFLLNRRLGIFLDQSALLLEEKEPFDVKGLERYILTYKLLERRLEGESLVNLKKIIKASGSLPPGAVGETLYDNLAQGIERFVSVLENLTGSSRLEPLDVDLDLSGFRIKGLISLITKERQIQYRFARLRAGDVLKAWIYHLILNCLSVEDYPNHTTLLCTDQDIEKEAGWKAWNFEPVEKSQTLLERLLAIYWEGLMRPVPLFPDTSWTYVKEKVAKERKDKEAVEVARKVWEGSGYNWSEGEDSHYRLCFGEADPLNAHFQSLALEVFSPIVAYSEKKKI